eukprot:gene6641-13451_t
MFDESLSWVIYIIGSVILAAIVLAAFLLRTKSGQRSKRKDIVLFLGPCGGGKTVLAYKLCLGESPETLTSMKASNLSYSSGQGSFPIVDFPGHPKLRTQLSDLLSRAKKIVFVVDASKVQSQVRDAAEFLYDLFTNPLMDNGPPMMIACNKSDVAGARPPARVKLALQQELEKIRKTRQSLEITGDSETIPLGREGKEFAIERDSPVEVTFSATSGKAGSLDMLTEFICFGTFSAQAFMSITSITSYIYICTENPIKP